MVLHSLGVQLAGALARLNTSAVVDDELVKGIIKDITSALIAADVNIRLVKKLRDNVEAAVAADEGAAGYNKARVVERAVQEELVGMLSPAREAFKPRKGKANVVMFVGLQGAGKTTTVAKYAHYYQQRHWKVAMVCADTFRAGAYDQLKQNAARVRVPFYGSYTEPDPVKIAAEGVAHFKREGFDIIIVDTSGRHKQEVALFEEMRDVRDAVRPDDIVFVMDSTIGQAAMGQAEAFKDAVSVGSCIITKLDGHAKGGGALSAVAATGSPIIFVGSGEHFDDLQAFDARAFVSKLLGRGDIRTLMTDMKEKGILEDSEEIMGRMTKGKFTFRDMHEQFATIMKLGPLNKVMEALPGDMSSILAAMPPGADSNARVKRMCSIMQSMTKKELDCEVVIDTSRLLRIARGAGVHPDEVAGLLQSHKQMEKMVGGMNKAGLLKGGDSAFASKMARNPQAVMNAMSKSMDPRLMSTMGGAGGLMSMMKGLAGGGAGGGDMMKKMGDMMKSMGLGR